MAPLPPTQYQHYAMAIVPGSLWQATSCWKAGGNLPVPHGICTPYANSMNEGVVRLAAGGIIDSPGATGYIGIGLAAAVAQAAAL